jgi:polyhydroxybutyrate depolymerase
MFTLPIQHGGIDREAIVYVPESYTAEQASPVLLNFHGFGGTAEDHMLWADMRPQADAENFIVVYPQGSLLDGDSHWNTSPPSDDNKSGADDFGFIEALLDEISAPYTVDRDRIYAAGYSNGGMFAFAMACYRSDQIAGVASVSGAMLDDIGESCTSPPTSIITLHGTEDEVLGYDGGYGFRSAEALVDYWLGVNGIDSEPSVDAGAQLESFRYTGGTQGTEVHHHRVIDGGHVWFELETEDTNDLIWTFLARFSTEGRL